jgi:hypothetical protein
LHYAGENVCPKTSCPKWRFIKWAPAEAAGHGGVRVGLVHAWRSLDDGLSRDAVDAPAKKGTIMYVSQAFVQMYISKKVFYPELFRALLQ